MSERSYAIPKGSTILVTGVTGYIGSNIVDVLLDLGYNVRGTVRSEKPWLDNFFTKKYGPGKFESVIVPAMEDDGAFNEVIKGASGVVHVAATLPGSPSEGMVARNVAGTMNILQAASKTETVKRVVLTSSVNAALIQKPNEKRVVDENTWNDDAVKAVSEAETLDNVSSHVVYAAAKTEAERKAWDFVAKNKPGFVLNTVLPNINYGRVLTPEIMGSSMFLVRLLLKGDSAFAFSFGPHHYVDVQDDARLHAIALLDPSVQSERLWATAAPHSWADVLAVLRKLRPENTQIPDPPAHDSLDMTEILPRKRSEELLRSFFGKGWTSLEDCIATGIEGFE